jgi:insulysin
MQDPESLPGLAHFTEHMLFYASAKYPEEDEYSKWIEDHGGHTNAWTAAEHTNYQFTVNWDHLASSLDRFAQVRLGTTQRDMPATRKHVLFDAPEAEAA